MSDAAEEAGDHPIAAGRLIDRHGRARLAFEPVADLARGVICGYEAVARFPEAVGLDLWRVEAERRGLEPDLDAFLVASVLHAREMLPLGCFLSFNIAPDALLREPVRDVLGRAGSLEGLVVELCPRTAPDDEAALAAAVAPLRRAGAAIAVDGVGSGVGTLRHIGVVRPEFVKLDPRLVAGVHHDDAKAAIVEAVGQLAGRLDAWIVAQGVERIQELDTLIRMRVPLAQGPLIGVRTKTLTRVGFPLSSYVRERGAAAAKPGALLALVDRLPALAHDSDHAALAGALDEDPGLLHLPLLDGRHRPVAMLERAAFERGEPPVDDVLVVGAASRILDVARRAMLRRPATRFHPLVCCDAAGRYVGVVRIERLVTALTRAHGDEALAGS